MKARARVASFALSLSVSLGSGCTKHVLRPPAGLGDAQELPVQGFSSGFKTSFRERDLKLGDYLVTHIDRDFDRGSERSSGGFVSETHSGAYRFDLRAGGRTLHGECTTDYESKGKAGFAKVSSRFGCECVEGGSPRAELDIVDGKGSARIVDNDYELAVLHQPERGGPVRANLGYRFKGPRGQQGVVDVTAHGRAWLPAALPEDESLGLVCGYAGLFLYRPVK